MLHFGGKKKPSFFEKLKNMFEIKDVDINSFDFERITRRVEKIGKRAKRLNRLIMAPTDGVSSSLSFTHIMITKRQLMRMICNYNPFKTVEHTSYMKIVEFLPEIMTVTSISGSFSHEPCKGVLGWSVDAIWVKVA